MRVNYLRLESTPRPDRVYEVRAEETDERQLRCPRRSDVPSHVAGVGETLITARRVTEPFNANSLDLVRFGNTFGGGRDDLHLDVFVAQSHRQAKNE